MSIFRRHVESPTRYTEEDLRKDVAAALSRARQAGIHSVICQRVIHSVADGAAQRRAMSEPVI